MAPVLVPKSKRTKERALARSKGSDVEKSSQSGSQSSDENQVTRLAAEMQREARKRREVRRTVINNSHRDTVRKLENAVTVKFEDITRRMIKRHRLRMDRLNELIQKRSAIEAKMFASCQNIENAFIYADKALAFAFGRRLQTMRKYQKAPIA